MDEGPFIYWLIGIIGVVVMLMVMFVLVHLCVVSEAGFAHVRRREGLAGNEVKRVTNRIWYVSFLYTKYEGNGFKDTKYKDNGWANERWFFRIYYRKEL